MIETITTWIENHFLTVITIILAWNALSLGGIARRKDREDKKRIEDENITYLIKYISIFNKIYTDIKLLKDKIDITDLQFHLFNAAIKFFEEDASKRFLILKALEKFCKEKGLEDFFKPIIAAIKNEYTDFPDEKEYTSYNKRGIIHRIKNNIKAYFYGFLKKTGPLNL